MTNTFTINIILAIAIATISFQSLAQSQGKIHVSSDRKWSMSSPTDWTSYNPKNPSIVLELKAIEPRPIHTNSECNLFPIINPSTEDQSNWRSNFFNKDIDSKTIMAGFINQQEEANKARARRFGGIYETIDSNYSSDFSSTPYREGYSIGRAIIPKKQLTIVQMEYFGMREVNGTRVALFCSVIQDNENMGQNSPTQLIRDYKPKFSEMLLSIKTRN